MKIQVKSLAFQIWISFLIMPVILGIWMLLFLRAEKKSENLSLFSFALTTTHNRFSENVVNYQNFILTGYKEEDFYLRDDQVNIRDYLHNLQEIQTEINRLEENSEDYDLQTENDFATLLQANNHLIQLAHSLKHQMQRRGFKDFGVEGAMRNSAHTLEDSSQIQRGEIYLLRRHEKDFLLRGEQQYHTKFTNLIDSLETKYAHNPKVVDLLYNYSTRFNEYVQISHQLGYYTETGLIGQIEKVHNRINHIFSGIKEKSSAKIMKLNQKSTNYLIVQSIFIAVLAILISYFLAKTLTHDFKLLNEKFNFYIRSGFLENPTEDTDKPNFKLSSIEIRKLFAKFQLLKETLNETVLRLNKEVEKSERAANYKARFLANMSHEIRTPLNGILGMLQLLKVNGLSDKQRKNLEIAEYSANHLLDVVNMILDHSKLEVGKMKVENRPLDLRLILKNLEGIFRYQASEKNLAFHIDYERSWNNKLQIDSLRLQQVLMNLLSNALKFTDSGSVRLLGKQIHEDDLSVTIKFSITDTGVGIEKKHQAKLFEAFEQYDISTTRKHGGTGLGLTITNHLVNLMGGELKLESERGKGSEFYFSLRFDKVFKEVHPLATEVTSDPNKFLNNRILIVEDNKINQLVLSKMLENLGFSYSLAENGKEAYDFFIKENFDAILMDIHMPKMNGLKATELIKNHPKYLYNQPPIIAITAGAFEEDRVEALNSGMDDFITKPIVFKNLTQVLQKYLSMEKVI